jgi:His/Glu/Gln/Arg/opine family amino acid ABC transporter permease subunit
MTPFDMLATLLVGYPLPPEMVDPRYPLFLQYSGGLLLTIQITVLSLFFGFLMGTGLAVCRRDMAPGGTRGEARRSVASVPRWLSIAATECIRGLPIMLLVLLVFDLPYRLLQVRVPAAILATIAFSVYAAAYLSEIVRAGLRSVNPELRQVGKTLGLSRSRILLKVELPIVWRNMMPDFVNLAVTVFKDTSTLAVVAVAELTYTARKMLMSEPIGYAVVWLLVLFLYWAVATALSMYSHYARHRRFDERLLHPV